MVDGTVIGGVVDRTYMEKMASSMVTGSWPSENFTIIADGHVVVNRAVVVVDNVDVGDSLVGVVGTVDRSRVSPSMLFSTGAPSRSETSRPSWVRSTTSWSSALAAKKGENFDSKPVAAATRVLAACSAAAVVGTAGSSAGAGSSRRAGAAAGSQGENHGQSQKQSQQFLGVFHLHFPPRNSSESGRVAAVLQHIMLHMLHRRGTPSASVHHRQYGQPQGQRFQIVFDYIPFGGVLSIHIPDFFHIFVEYDDFYAHSSPLTVRLRATEVAPASTSRPINPSANGSVPGKSVPAPSRIRWTTSVTIDAKCGKIPVTSLPRTRSLGHAGGPNVVPHRVSLRRPGLHKSQTTARRRRQA